MTARRGAGDGAGRAVCGVPAGVGRCRSARPGLGLSTEKAGRVAGRGPAAITHLRVRPSLPAGAPTPAPPRGGPAAGSASSRTARGGAACLPPAQGHSGDATSPRARPSGKKGAKAWPSASPPAKRPAEARDPATPNARARAGGSPLNACPQPLQPGFGCPGDLPSAPLLSPILGLVSRQCPPARSWGASGWAGSQDARQQEPGIARPPLRPHTLAGPGDNAVWWPGRRCGGQPRPSTPPQCQPSPQSYGRRRPCAHRTHAGRLCTDSPRSPRAPRTPRALPCSLLHPQTAPGRGSQHERGLQATAAAPLLRGPRALRGTCRPGSIVGAPTGLRH